MKFIELSKGQKAIVDDEDFDWLSRWNWYAHNPMGKFYALRTIGGYKDRKALFMHRLIIGAKKGQDVDHKNGNGLDNRKENLRIATRAQNQANKSGNKNSTSKYRGISWNSRVKKWVAQIVCRGKHYHLGYFKKELEAVDVWNKKAKKIYGEFARLNLINY